MPFIEIVVREESWVSIRERGVSISIDLRHKYFVNEDKTLKHVRVFFDEENELVGLKPDDKGFKVNKKGEVYCSTIQGNLDLGKYRAEWSDKHNMLIVNLNEKIE